MEDHTTAQSLLSQLITAPDEAQAKVMYQYVSEMNSGTFDKLLELSQESSGLQANG